MDRQRTLNGGETEPWRNAELMRELFEDADAVTEIADELDCGKSTVFRWLDRHGIRLQNRENIPPSFHTRVDGYEAVIDDNENVLVHRLVAVAEFGFETVVGSVIHHKNQCKWDNRPVNLQPFDSHAAHHREHHRPKPTDDQDELSSYPRSTTIEREPDDAQTTLEDF